MKPKPVTCQIAALACAAALAAPAFAQVATQRANPASVNCLRLGGTLAIEKRGDGGEFGVCRFEDNRQCEEWALFRGACPEGGVKVTGFATEAARYCAITGGAYTATSRGAADDERGTCVLPDGRSCDAAEYFNGGCPPAALPETDDPFAYCASAGTVDVPGPAYVGPPVPDAVVHGLVARGVVSADAPPEFQRHATWRCLDGRVLACHFGANLPCQEKADDTQAPTPEMTAFCREQPEAEAIPTAITGRATVFAWGCRAGAPRALRQVLHADARGFLSEFWYALAPPK